MDVGDPPAEFLGWIFNLFGLGVQVDSAVFGGWMMNLSCTFGVEGAAGDGFFLRPSVTERLLGVSLRFRIG